MPTVGATQERSDVADAGWRDFPPLALHPILRHAMEAFNEHGYHGTSVRDIAARVGVTVPMIYYHHQNKQAVLVALLETGIDDVLTRCQRAVESAGDDPVAQLSAFVECLVLFSAHRRGLAFLDTELRSLEPENRARYVAKRDELEAMLRRTVLTGVRTGQLHTPLPVEASRAILAMCQAVAVWFRLDGPDKPAAVARRYVTLSLDTLRERRH